MNKFPNSQLVIKLWTTLPLVLLIAAPGCSGPGKQTRASNAPQESQQAGEDVRPLSLSAIRRRLTHDLTMSEANRLFGAPYGPTFVSGHLYPVWLLDEGNRLHTAFAIDSGRLLRAEVMKPGGEIIKRVLEDPKR